MATSQMIMAEYHLPCVRVHGEISSPGMNGLCHLRGGGVVQGQICG